MDLAVKPHFSDKLKADLRKDFSKTALAGKPQLWTGVNLVLVVAIIAVWALLAMPHKSPVAKINTSKTASAETQTTQPTGAVLGAKTYTVQSGDTLYGVASKSGVSWQHLAEWNGLQPPYALTVGGQLKLSAQ